jgi:hypothetical protein
MRTAFGKCLVPIVVSALFSPRLFSAGAEEPFILLPAKFTLTGPTARQQVLVEQYGEKGYNGELTNGIAWRVSDTNIVTVDDGSVTARGNGTAVVTVARGNQFANARVTVEGVERRGEYSFRNQVQPVLAKNGCSAGACHGAAAGQNGFKLSLRGYDDEGDFLTLTRQAFGRRIIPSDPGRSLLLLKPTRTVPHKGGQRFEVGSPDYQILAGWIAAGTPGPRPDEPRIDHLELNPDHVVLQPGAGQRLNVRAFFTDGHAEDVTRWAKFTAVDGAVAQVGDDGGLKVVGPGESAVTAWYLSRIAIATVTVPYTNAVAAERFAQTEKRNFIDELVLEKLQTLNLPPSPRAADSEFIRRAYLDTTGLLPPAVETRAFLADQSEGKRDRLIEKLLASHEFVDYWAYKWSDLLLVSSKKLRPAAMWAYYRWIRDNVAANTPWDVFVRRVVTAKGDTLENGAANFYVLREDPRDMAETTSQAFLGMSINCAKCHNHPLEKWTNDQYYQMANLFARVRMKSGSGDGENIIFAASSGDLIQPLRGKPQPPAPLEAKPLSPDAQEDRREYLADWLVSRENTYFSRAIVNRVWANFMGVGLVEKVDDLRVTNPASNEKLLSAAARYLADQKFDLKALMRVILQSETYQRSGQALPQNAADQRFYSHYYPKRLMAEVMLDTVSQVCGAPTRFNGYPEGWRAMQLPDSNVDSYFLRSFGRPDRDKTCECERTANPNVTQVLHIANGDTINQKLQAKGNRIETELKDKWPAEKTVEETFLSALCRYPTKHEKQSFVHVIDEAPEADRRPVIEDFYWAILSSREFLFNH